MSEINFYDKLRDELNDSSVISDNFKSRILLLAQNAIRQGYERGLNDAGECGNNFTTWEDELIQDIKRLQDHPTTKGVVVQAIRHYWERATGKKL